MKGNIERTGFTSHVENTPPLHEAPSLHLKKPAVHLPIIQMDTMDAPGAANERSSHIELQILKPKQEKIPKTTQEVPFSEVLEKAKRAVVADNYSENGLKDIQGKLEEGQKKIQNSSWFYKLFGSTLFLGGFYRESVVLRHHIETRMTGLDTSSPDQKKV